MLQVSIFSHGSWFNFRVDTCKAKFLSETAATGPIFICTFPDGPLWLQRQETPYQQQQQLYAVLLQLIGYFDLGLKLLHWALCFSLPVLNKRQAARKCISQSAAALHFANMCNHSQRALYPDGSESRDCAVSRVKADRAVLHVLISTDISHRVYSHASTEVSLIFILSQMLLCW